MRVIYRAANATDVHGVAMAHLATYRETWRGLVEDRDLRPAPLEEHIATWSARIADPFVSVIVADCDGEIIGAGACGADDGDALGDGVILDILVMKHMQCRGVGTRLMGQMARALHERGHAGASLWAPERNITAIVFFRAIGGAIVDAVAHREDTGLPALKLRWEPLEDLAFWDDRAGCVRDKSQERSRLDNKSASHAKA